MVVAAAVKTLESNHTSNAYTFFDTGCYLKIAAFKGMWSGHTAVFTVLERVLIKIFPIRVNIFSYQLLKVFRIMFLQWKQALHNPLNCHSKMACSMSCVRHTITHE